MKEALKMIHDFFERTKNSRPEESEQVTKDRIRMQKYLRYVLDQVRHTQLLRLLRHDLIFHCMVNACICF